MRHTSRRVALPIAAAAVAGLIGLTADRPLAVGDPAPGLEQAAPQQPAAGQDAGRGGQGRRGGGGGGGRGSAPIPFEDQTGFTAIFDGKTLTGWDGDPQFWRAENGAIVGESTTEKVVKPNTFLIWRGGEPADFELKLEFRINSTNSGVQYRSVEMPEVAKWVLKGYQADIDFANRYTGMLYEERGRGIIAERGTVGYGRPAPPAPPARGFGQLAALEDGAALQAHIKQNDWNQFQVIARGTVLIHILNGRVMALFVDDDAANRSMKGLIGLQMHSGPPMKVEFRNIWLKAL
jgi:hypothetical protein